jgi:aspartate aminotransferase
VLRVPAICGAPVSGGSFVEAKEHVIVLGSLSKTYAMTGWRAGFALGPKPIIAAMSKLQSQSTSSTAAIVQKAAIAALSGRRNAWPRCGRITSNCATASWPD